jgi:hypothetical protein
MSLNTALGWSEGDDVRTLVAAGLPVGIYQVTRIQQDMNYLAEQVPSVVSPIIDLLDAWETAQSSLATLNETSEGRILTKVDVLEWAATNPGTSYSPERELQRIRGLLYQYFASSTLFTAPAGGDGAIYLVHS